MMANRNSTKSFLFGALAGGIIGSVTALLLAPKPGRELRQDIADGAQQVGETTVRIAGQVGETTSRIVKQVGSGASQAAVKAKDAAGSIIGTVRSWRGGADEEDSQTLVSLNAIEETVELSEDNQKEETELQLTT
ncbi:YtxH domain-containing protein [Paenibacillus spongiae]|uniref:YtxH domain-containing protein n=1 Tax=Paenibacillus spongiae TaxID=2909671 RepID=A0ABY5S2V3_9BACL|nr:YtxH domain-containing protein [Paenibacillus spongiae]UVI28224.1 YtxH domain-containing protein [Paenibacillus spongiae]